MPSYRILPHPGVNAVFFDASETLSLAELSLCLSKLQTRCGEPAACSLAGARWYAFDAENRLPEEDIARLSKLSSLYALFQTEGALLSPIEPIVFRPFPESLSAILKYTGKTNALFTRLMLHIAELSLPDASTGRMTPEKKDSGMPGKISDHNTVEYIEDHEAITNEDNTFRPSPKPLRLLDPVAGKGTTLYEALMRGWDAAGIEIVAGAAHEAAVYFQKYLETEKWKHKAQKEKIHGAASWRFRFARDKQGLNDSPGEWFMIAGDGKLADRFFGKAAFDIVAGDLPYGVSHGNVAGGRLMRSPVALLSECLPAWRAVLKPRGVLALSYNCLSLPREEICSLLSQNAFHVLSEPPYDRLAHRVDASIRRDIVVGVKE